MAEQGVKLTKESAGFLLSATMEALGSIVDLRQTSKVRYPIQDIVLLVVAAAAAAKVESWKEIQTYGESNLDELICGIL